MAVSQFLIPAVSLSLCATAARAESPQPLQMTPSSKWVVDYAEDSCALRREFQAGDDRAILELRQFGPGDSLQVALVSKTLSRTSRAPRVRFDPDDDFFEPVAPFFLDIGETRGVTYSDNFRPNAVKGSLGPWEDWPPADREARERAITGLSVTRSFEQSLTLQTGPMHEPMEAMRTCLDELLTHWGLDAAAQRTLSRRVKAIDQMGWARRIQTTYPSDMVRTGQSGRVNIRLIVGADGKPASCIPNIGPSNAAFDELACKMSMRYARFEPALDADGRPIASFFTTSIIYTISR